MEGVLQKVPGRGNELVSLVLGVQRGEELALKLVADGFIIVFVEARGSSAHDGYYFYMRVTSLWRGRIQIMNEIK